MSATTLWKLVLTHPEPQVPEALRAPALAHLASVLDRPVEALEARLAAVEGRADAPQVADVDQRLRVVERK